MTSRDYQLSAVAIILSASIGAACGGDGAIEPGADASDVALVDSSVGDALASLDGAADSASLDDGRQDSTTGALDGAGDALASDSAEEDAADTTPAPRCDALPSLPASFQVYEGILSQEDFAFDAEGNLVSIDAEGNLVRNKKNGDTQLWVPGVAGETAGIAYLPSGDLVFASVDTETVYRVTPAGGREAILSGLQYPNGLTTDREGMVYVAEQNGGRIRRIDPATGGFEILVRGLFNPNGLAFSPDERILYVGSFGGGTVYGIPLDDNGTVGTPFLLAQTPDAPPDTSHPVVGGGDLETEACAGESAGSECSFEVGGRTLSGVCSSVQGALFCETGTAGGPGDDPWTEACAGLSIGAECTVSLSGAEASGHCLVDGGWTYCDADPYGVFYMACEGRSEGQPCALGDSEISGGVCVDDGMGGLLCFDKSQPLPGMEAGGLDGIAVDACGNVYVTEYLLGIVWRIAPDGSSVDKVAKLPTEWIPNMEFGSGVGGWERDVLYVINREAPVVYGIEVGVLGPPPILSP